MTLIQHVVPICRFSVNIPPCRSMGTFKVERAERVATCPCRASAALGDSYGAAKQYQTLSSVRDHASPKHMTLAGEILTRKLAYAADQCVAGRGAHPGVFSAQSQTLSGSGGNFQDFRPAPPGCQFPQLNGPAGRAPACLLASCAFLIGFQVVTEFCHAQHGGGSKPRRTWGVASEEIVLFNRLGACYV